MKSLLKALIKYREVFYVATILVLGWRVFAGGPDFSGVVSGTSGPVVVEEPGLTEEVIADAKKADKPRGIVERLGTTELTPDSVYVSGPVPPVGIEDGGDTPGDTPRRVPSVALELPEWGIQEVEKEGPKLTISALNRRTGGAERKVYTLGARDSDFTIRSGNVSASVREDRELRFINFRLSGTAYAGLNAATGEPRALILVKGPISVGTERIRLHPTVVGSVGEGASVGVSADFCLIGRC